jgi:hypothetical protein
MSFETVMVTVLVLDTDAAIDAVGVITLVPVLRQAKRECDRFCDPSGSKIQSAAAPATVTGKVDPMPLAPPFTGRLGRRVDRGGNPESASRETCQRM